MSLIGSLEDLNLGDILQIIYLSQKSGALVIRSDEGEGRILFREGLVCGGVAKGGPTDLRGLLVGGGFVDAADFDAVADECGSEAGALEAAVLGKALITAERLDSLRRESIEAAVGSMFQWQTGEFSFDLAREFESEGSELMLARGINPQFLAMERVRLEDESERGGSFEYEEVEDDPNGMSAEEMFVGAASASAEEAIESDPVNAMAMASADRVEAAECEASEAEAPPLLEPEPETTADAAVAAEPPAAPEAPRSDCPLVVIDPDLGVLEWVKETLKSDFEKIHIFQRSDLGLQRIRQYLVRGTLPTVLLSPAISGDPSAGIRDAGDFARRLKGQAQNALILWLCEDGEAAPGDVGDGRLERPTARLFRAQSKPDELDRMAASLRSELGFESAGASADAAGGPATASAVAVSFRDASSRGEILPLLITHARSSFSRVAMFLVGDEAVVGIAQSGLDACGGPDDDGMRAIDFAGDGSAWLRQVLATKRPLVATPQDDGDRALAMRLGDREPLEVYLAPITAAGEIVALLYADHLPSADPVGDTTAIEEAVLHASLAFDREIRERTGQS